MTEAKLRSNLFLTDLPPGSPERATGKSAGGFRRGVGETPPAGSRFMREPCSDEEKRLTRPGKQGYNPGKAVLKRRKKNPWNSTKKMP